MDVAMALIYRSWCTQ